MREGNGPVARLLLWLTNGDPYTHAMLGDLIEARARRARRGPVRAAMWYAVTVAGIAVRYVPRRRWRVQQTSSGEPMIKGLTQDVRYGLRSMMRVPAFTLTVLCTIALGIGANVAIFTVVNAVLLRPLPFRDSDRVIQLANGASAASLSEPEFVDLQRDARSFADIGAFSYTDGNVTGGVEAERVRIARVTAGFFRVLGTEPVAGRGFTAEEDVPGGPDAVVISHGLWVRRFGGAADVVGKDITINGVERVIVGVMPRHFDFPTASVAVWTPLRLNPDSLWARNNHYLRVIARLQPGVSMQGAQAEVVGLRERWAREYPEAYRADDPLIADVAPIRERVLGQTRPYMIALAGAVGFVLLIACVNVANLLLARGEGRRKEIAIRAALGATRSRIAAQLSAESALLAGAGGAIGLALAWPLQRVLVAVAPASLPRVQSIAMDGSVLLFTVGLCTLTGMLFALAPIVRGAATSALATLNSGTRNTSAGGRSARGTRTVLVVSEIALAVMMLTGAGMFLRHLLALQRTDLGFATHNIETLRLSLPNGAYNGASAVAFVDELVARVSRLPNVRSASAMAWTPIVDGGGSWSIMGDATTPADMSEAPVTAPQQVTPEFFATLSIPLMRGRTLQATDRASAPLVVVVNQTLARTLWGERDPIGRRLRLMGEGSPWAEVVGVVGDTRVDGITEPAPPIVYFPHAQAGQSGYFTANSMTLLIAHGAGESVIPAVRHAVQELDPNVPISEVRSMDDVVASTIANHRFTTLLLAGFALLALLLAAVGIYGVIAYQVTQRRYEFGVRMALGAGSGGVLRQVVKEGMMLTVSGLVLGLAGALMVGRLLAAMLSGIGAVDAVTMAAVSGFLICVALLALAIPATQAMRVSPTEALRGG